MVEVKVENDGDRYFCGICDYQTKRNNCLKLHIRTIHEGVRFSCDQCEHQTNQSSNLNKHKRNVHSLQTRPVQIYNCKNCSRVFKSKDGLRGHLKGVHEGVRLHC